MKLFGQILLACVALAILQAALAVVVVGALLAAVVFLIFKPRETMGVIGLCLMVGLIQAQPALALILMVAIVVLNRSRPGPTADAGHEPLRLTHVPTEAPADGDNPSSTNNPA